MGPSLVAVQACARVPRPWAIWTQSKPEYHGDLVSFPPMMTWPKPVQKPHPPVIVGGAHPYGARRAIAYGDGWCSTPAVQPTARCSIFARLQKMATAAGRDPATIPTRSSAWLRTWT